MSETVATDEPILRIVDLHKSFGETVVLRGIDVDIHRGEVVVVLGPSGSGKSTMLRCLNRLEEPTSGKIFFEGQDITDPKTDVNDVRKRMGMVFQQFNLFPHLDAMHNVMLAQQKVLGRSAEEAERVARESEGLSPLYLAVDGELVGVIGIEDPLTSREIDFIGGSRGIGELEKLVDSGRYAIAFSMYPTTVEQLMAIADAGAIMPPKSTWFEPKLRDGLVCHNF